MQTHTVSHCVSCRTHWRQKQVIISQVLGGGVMSSMQLNVTIKVYTTCSFIDMYVRVQG